MPVRLVAERKEDPAAVRVEPVQLELARFAEELETRDRETAEPDQAAGASRNLQRRRLDVPNHCVRPEARVVGKIRRLGPDAW